MKTKSIVALPSVILLTVSMLSGCYEFEHFKDKLKLTDAQAEKARPIIEKYLAQQNKIFEEMKSERSARSSEGTQSAGDAWTSNSGSTNRTELREAMEKKKAEMEKSFADNDAAAAQELATFLTPEQIAEFKTAAEDFRKQEMREQMQPSHGGHGGGGRHRGGMGFGAGGGMGGPGGGMGNY